jgi:hypothetical protein
MKNLLVNPIRCALGLFLSLSVFSASSCLAAGHLSQAAALSGAASVEALGAVGDSVEMGVRASAAVGAAPVMLSGAALAGSGAIVGSIAAATTDLGGALFGGGQELWDFAGSDPARRPPLNRERSVPPLKKPTAAPVDPSPAVAMKIKR